jgi:predicted TIM-barrel fold metal-dependent hydrolase
VEVPPDQWTKYVPGKYRDRAPRLVKLEDGGEGWVIEGQPVLHNGQNITGRGPIRFRNASYFNPDGSPATGAGGAKQRLQEQDQDGIDAEVLFPPIFATKFLEGVSDRRIYCSMVQAYNTFLAQDYCSIAPDRLIGCGVVPVSGIDDALNELKRCSQLGLKAVCFYQYPNGGSRPKPEDDRFWATALELQMALAPHVFFGDRTLPPVDHAKGTANQEFLYFLAARSQAGPLVNVAVTFTSGLFERFPQLKIYIAETNASWLPSAVWMMEDSYQIFKDACGVRLKRLPSEYIRDHFYFGFVRDPLAIRLRDHLPVENLMWGSDFPHSVGSFPDSRKWLDIIFDEPIPKCGGGRS